MNFHICDIIVLVIEMKFTKMHGLGNDYIYINLFEEEETDFSYLSQVLSDRHFGIGADGIITISKSDKADCFMQIYNADGSKGEMCGNGIRCVGKYVYESGIVTKDIITVDTLAGIKTLKLNIVNDKVDSVIVDMGIPTTHSGEGIDINVMQHDLTVLGQKYSVIDVSMGNPHTVIFVPEITDYLVLEVGKLIECDSYYPNRTNVEFVEIINENTLKMRVYERGSGETMACGTGSCATAVAYMLKNPHITSVEVQLLGGNLKISKNNEGHIFMDGPATKVFDGFFDVNDIIK